VRLAARSEARLMELAARLRDERSDEDRYRELMARFPRGRAASVREIAGAVAFLASDRPAYTSGVIYTIDGGLCARTSVL